MFATAQPRQGLAHLTGAFDRIRAPGGRASQDKCADVLGEIQCQHLSDAPAHRCSVDGSAGNSEMIENLGGISGEARSRELGQFATAAAGAAVVEGDGAKLRFEVRAQLIPPAMRVRLPLEEKQSRCLSWPADLDLEWETVTSGDGALIPGLHVVYLFTGVRPEHLGLGHEAIAVSQ